MWSLLRTILAVLNVLGALAFISLAAMDYGRRQTWAYANVLHDAAEQGMPLDKDETNAEGQKLVDLIGEQGRKELFGSLQPVATQLEEVQTYKTAFDGAISAAKDKREQLLTLARILTPLAGSNTQREKYASVRAYTTTDNSVKQLKEEVIAAAAPPKAEPGQQPKPFEATFAQRVEALPGPSRAPFVEAFLAEHKKSPAKKPEELFDDSLEHLRADLQATYDTAFAAATQGRIEGSNKTATVPERKAAIAFLLFNLTEPLSEIQTRQAFPPGQPWDVTKEIYRRYLTVVGLAAGVKAIRQEALVLARIAEEMKLDIARDRSVFVAAHQELVTQLQQAAAREVGLNEVLGREKELLARQQALINRRKNDIVVFEADLARLRKETADRLAGVHDMTDELYKVRIATRNASEANQKYEKEIRNLEAGR
jgi:hypothetical protein